MRRSSRAPRRRSARSRRRTSPARAAAPEDSLEGQPNMKFENIFIKSCALVVCALYAGLVACSSADNDLARFIEDTKKEPGGRVEPLPEVKPYETFVYSASTMRSPFTPGGSGGSAAGLRPDSKRKREFLEPFSLDTLKMARTLQLS